MGMNDYGIAIGSPADMIMLDRQSAASAVRELAPALTGFKRGRRTLTRQPPVLHAP